MHPLRYSLSGATVSSLLAAYFSVGGLPGVAIAIAPAPPSAPTDGLYCSDRYGNHVQDGVEYMPEDDPCKKCQCQSGFPVMCRSVLCSPPACSLYESLKNECCEFRCIEPSLDFPRNNGNGTNHIYPMFKDANGVNLSIRLVASAVTSLLIIALLIFMIHRLRQRRLLITMRRLNNDRRSINEALAYMTNIDQLDIGFEFPPYEDPPPPYSPPKPLDDIPMEDPPPYEMSGNSHLETDGRSVVGESADIHRMVVSAADVRQLRDTLLVGSHPLRTCSAAESLHSELIELTQFNPCLKSVVAVSSPALASHKRIQQDGKAQLSAGIADCCRRSTEECNVTAEGSTSSCMAGLSLPAFDQMMCSHLGNKQLQTDSLAPQVLVKMHRKMPCSSLLRNSAELNGNPYTTRLEENHRKNEVELIGSPGELQSEVAEWPVKWFNGIKAKSDACEQVHVDISNPKAVDNDTDETRARLLSSSWNFVTGGNADLMQRSAPEVSEHLDSCKQSCLNLSKETELQQLTKNRNDKPEYKLSLSNSSFLKRQKPKTQRSQSYVVSAPTASNMSIFDHLHTNLQLRNLTDDCHTEAAMCRKLISAKDASSAPAYNLCDVSASTLDSAMAHKKVYTAQISKDVLQQFTAEDPQHSEVVNIKQPADDNSTVSDFSDSRCIQHSSSGNGLQTPDSPVNQQVLRSESVTSHASFFSICSETGEKKHVKSLLPWKTKSPNGQNAIPATFGFQSSDCGWTSGMRESAVDADQSFGELCGDNRSEDFLQDVNSASSVTSSEAMDSSKNHSCFNWNFMQEHSPGESYETSLSDKKHEKGQAEYLNELSDIWSFSPVKYGNDLPNHRGYVGGPLARQSYPNHYNQNMVNNMENHSPTKATFYSSSDVWNLSGENCLMATRSTKDKAELKRKDDKDFFSSQVEQSFFKRKDHMKSGKRHKPKPLESVEYLVSRILQQLETAYFDDFGIHQKVHKAQRCGYQYGRRSADIGQVLNRNFKQSQAVSLPSTKSCFIDDVSIARQAELDLANRNDCKIKADGKVNNECRHVLCNSDG